MHPDLYPNWYIEYKGSYLFCLLMRGVPKDEATINLFAIDAAGEQVAGPIPPTMIYGNPELADKLKNPHMVSGEDQKPIKHFGMDSDYIAHYGIKGQKWGIRRFQNLDGTLTVEGKERYLKKEGSGESSKKTESEASDSSKKDKVGFFEKGRIRTAEYGDKILEAMNKPMENNVDRDKTKKGGVDKGRVATEVALTVINPLNALNFAADGAMALVAKSKQKKYFEGREEKSELDPKTGLYMKKEGVYSEKEDLAAVNPGFMNMNTNTKNNCMLCTTTYDLRKRGYDVTAQLDSQGYNFADLKRWYPKAKIIQNTRYDETGRALKQKEYVEKTMNSLLKQGDGARGNLMVWFNSGGGHSVAYEVKNGKVSFKDGQANINMDGKSGFSVLHLSPERFLSDTLVNSYARLDNVSPDLKKIIKECVM